MYNFPLSAAAQASGHAGAYADAQAGILTQFSIINSSNADSFKLDLVSTFLPSCFSLPAFSLFPAGLQSLLSAGQA